MDEQGNSLLIQKKVIQAKAIVNTNGEVKEFNRFQSKKKLEEKSKEIQKENGNVPKESASGLNPISNPTVATLKYDDQKQAVGAEKPAQNSNQGMTSLHQPGTSMRNATKHSELII